jgi:hypothetical protein
MAVMRKREQWALLNLLYQRSLFTSDRTAPDMLRISGADRAALGDLEAEGLVRGSRWGRGGVRAVRGLGEPGTDLSDVRLRITADGMAWLETDPFNRVLMACPSAWLGHRIRFADAVAEYDLDLDAVAACIDAGLAYLYRRDSGEHASDVSPRFLRHVLRQRAAWRLSATLDGRRVLAI